MDETLYEWTARAAEALGFPAEAGWVSDPAQVRAVLDLARDAAQNVTRPAAPPAAFLAGIAVGLAGASDPGQLEAARARLAETYGELAAGD